MNKSERYFRFDNQCPNLESADVMKCFNDNPDASRNLHTPETILALLNWLLGVWENFIGLEDEKWGFLIEREGKICDDALKEKSRYINVDEFELLRKFFVNLKIGDNEAVLEKCVDFSLFIVKLIQISYIDDFQFNFSTLGLYRFENVWN
jgi:hypothetical protein